MGFPHLNGKTKVCGLFGFPVEHSFSPAMHNAAFEQMGLNWAYMPFEVHPDKLPQAVQGITALGLVGANVTVPHKQKVIPLLHELDAAARLIGAVNTIVSEKGKLIGYNTDGKGFVTSLEKDAKYNCNNKKVLILGAGGAARAVAVQLALAGVNKLYITNRSREKAAQLAWEIEQGTAIQAEVLGWGTELPGSRVAEMDLIVQTTSLGMSPACNIAPDFPYEALHSGQVVCDLIYNPETTLFLKKAAMQKAKIYNGLGMLLYQGVLAFELWTGLRAPVEVMREALYKQVKKI